MSSNAAFTGGRLPDAPKPQLRHSGRAGVAPASASRYAEESWEEF